MNSIPRGGPARVLPQTVTIFPQCRSDMGLESHTHGSGVFINNTGLILTCAHVMFHTSGGLTVATSDGMQWPAQLVASSQEADIALVQLTTLPDTPTPAAVFAPVADMQVGDPVFAVGAPVSSRMQHSVTFGRISCAHRYSPGDNCFPMPVVQTDTAASSGNSGGGLFDAQGRLVGINSYIRGVPHPENDVLMSCGYTFALRADALQRVIDLLLEGYVPRSFMLGATLGRHGPATAKALGLGAYGLVVRDVVEGCLAHNMKLAVDDVILEVNGQPLTDAFHLQSEMMLSMNGALTLKVWRDGKVFEHVEDIPGLKRRTGYRKRKGFTAFGLQLKTTRKAVTVTRVEPGSPATAEGYLGDETITHVKVGGDWVAVTSVTQLNKIAKNDTILVRISGYEGPMMTIYKAK